MNRIVCFLALIFAFNTQAQTISPIEQCFKVDAETKGKFTLRNNNLVVDWDIADDAGYTEERGRVLDFEQTQPAIIFETYLQGTGDGSDFKVVIRKTQISFQGLWSSGEPIDEPTIYKFVKCSK